MSNKLTPLQECLCKNNIKVERDLFVDRKWAVELKIDHQYFTIRPLADSENKGKWYKRQLAIALSKLILQHKE